MLTMVHGVQGLCDTCHSSSHWRQILDLERKDIGDHGGTHRNVWTSGWCENEAEPCISVISWNEWIIQANFALISTVARAHINSKVFLYLQVIYICFKLAQSQPELSYASHFFFFFFFWRLTEQRDKWDNYLPSRWPHLRSPLCDAASSPPDSTQFLARAYKIPPNDVGPPLLALSPVLIWCWPEHGKWGTLCSSNARCPIC